MNCWIDGVAGATPSAFDRGLHYGDGLFETMTCRRGQLRFADLHFDRLARGCARLGIAGLDLEALRRETAAACSTEAAVIKVIVTRGSGGRGYAPGGAGAPTRIVLRYPMPLDPEEFWTQGVNVAWSGVRLADQPRLAGIKHLNRLEQVLARAEIAASDDIEALMCDADGHVICGTMSNVFIVDAHRLRTPRLDHAGVAGVMRAVLLREAPSLGLQIEEGALGREDLMAAREIFLTNARIGVWPVRRLGGDARDPGPVTRQLQAHLARLDH